MAPRTEGYAYDAGVWDLSIVQGPSVAPCQTFSVTIRNFFIAAHLRGGLAAEEAALREGAVQRVAAQLVL
jgi:hypothetical protein